MASTQKFDFFATTAKGMEDLLLEELKGLGAQSVLKGKAGVSFQGPLETGYRACLWSRIANRILLPLKTFPASDPDRLYGGVRSIHWTDHLSEKNTLAVDFSVSHSQITHSHYAALKVKDAIVDQFRSVKGSRPSVSPRRPDVQVNVYLHNDEATVSLDLSGESLHRRGYRQELSPAPLKENLAAALLMTAGWTSREDQSSDLALLDPMCGSGTLAIEAALIAGNIAPGLGRDYFGFLGWAGHDAGLWSKLKEEAQEKILFKPGLVRKRSPKIIGYDQDFRAIRVALSNLERVNFPGLRVGAGGGLLRGHVHFEKRDLSECEAPSEKGIFIVNPPYGERLGDVEALKPLYKQLGDTLKQKFQGWEGYIFTGNPDLAKTIGLKASRRSVFFNGSIECRLLKYELYESSREIRVLKV